MTARECDLVEDLEICYRSAIDLGRAIASRDLSPVEVVESFLERIERLNPDLNAYCTITADQARAEARQAEAAVMACDELGPLHGVPVSIKDLIATRGVRTTRGSKLYENWVPDDDAPVVERLKQAGAIVLGKTNTPEFGWKGVTDNLIFGPTRNPWDRERTPGGSSGGSGAQVAAALGPIAIGSDGGGSIRIPAAFSGCYGFKPSFGRVPMWPPSPAETLSHTGPLTYNVRDAALTMNVIAGPDDRDRGSLPGSRVDCLEACDGDLSGLKVAFSPNLGYAPVELEVQLTVESAAARFTELGCHLEAVELDWPDPEETWNHFFYGAIIGTVGERFEEVRGLLDPGLAAVAEERLSASMLQYMQAQSARQAFWDQVRKLFQKYDLLITPTVPIEAFEVMRNTPGEVAGQPVKGLGWSPFTFPFNLTGQPAASLPCGFSSAGLPIGLQVVGRRHDDATVLLASAAYESAAPWQGRRPLL